MNAVQFIIKVAETPLTHSRAKCVECNARCIRHPLVSLHLCLFSETSGYSTEVKVKLITALWHRYITQNIGSQRNPACLIHNRIFLVKIGTDISVSQLPSFKSCVTDNPF